MKQALLDELLASVVRVEITRAAGEQTATLSIRNDVEISGELKQRGKQHAARTVNIPDSANAFFDIFKAKLQDAGYSLSNEERENLPMKRGTKDFSITTTIEVGDTPDEVLRESFRAIFGASQARMAAARYNRRAGEWSDKQGGNASTLGGL